MAHWYLIHGAASTRLTWTKQLRALPDVKRASLPFFPDILPDQLIEAWAQWCLHELSEPSVILGHSMGGAIALTMALKEPSKVLGLVLAGTGPRLPVNAALLNQLQDNPDLALANIARWSLAKEPNPALLAKSLEQVKQQNPQRVLQEFRACNSFDVRSSLPQLTMPKALIMAEEDRMTTSALMKEFLVAWPDTPIYSVPQAGHMMMLEQPQAFNQLLHQIAQRFKW